VAGSCLAGPTTSGGERVGLVLLLVVVNAVFAGSEVALISLREGQLRRLDARGGRGRLVARLVRDPNQFLSTVQIGITLAGFLASAVAAVSLAEPLSFLGPRAEPTAIVINEYGGTEASMTTFVRHDPVNGRRYEQPPEVTFEDRRFAPGRKPSPDAQPRGADTDVPDVLSRDRPRGWGRPAWCPGGRGRRRRARWSRPGTGPGRTRRRGWRGGRGCRPGRRARRTRPGC
jgi:hypothetical protein